VVTSVGARCDDAFDGQRESVTGGQFSIDLISFADAADASFGWACFSDGDALAGRQVA
jgi:hypothetical protein